MENMHSCYGNSFSMQHNNNNKWSKKRFNFLIQIFQREHLFNCSTLIPIPVTLLG